MHERRFSGDTARLRSSERVERLEVERTVNLCLEHVHVKSVLDVGTGTALFAEAFDRHGLSVSGVDANPEMMAAAHLYVPNGDFRVGVAEALPYQDGSFDLVFFGLVLHETDEIQTAIKEGRRVARERVCILEWPYRAQSFGPPLADRLNPASLLGLFSEAGFRVWETIELTNTILYRLKG